MSRDHYVPQFLLRNWEREQDGKSIFWVYEKQSGRVHPGSAKATGFELDHDTFERSDGTEVSLQESYAAAEGEAARILRQCLETGEPPTGEARVAWAWFMAISFCRVPRIRDQVKAQVEGVVVAWSQGLARRPEFLERHVDRIERETGESLGDRGKLLEALKATGKDVTVELKNPKYAQAVALRAVDGLAPHLLALEWGLCRTDPEMPFLTGDVPLCVCAPDPSGSGGWLINSGFGAAGVEVVCPLSPEQCLVLSGDVSQRSWKASERRVTEINEKMVLSASNYVISPICSKRTLGLVKRAMAGQPEAAVRVERIEVSEREDRVAIRHVPHRLRRPPPRRPR